MQYASEPGRALRPIQSVAAIDLRKRRAWHDDASDTDTPPDKTGAQDAGGSTETTFTQADVDRIVGERARRARESGLSDFLKDLGFEKADDLKALVQDARTRAEAEKSELEKAQGEIDKWKAEAEAYKSAMEQALQTARAEKRNAAILSALNNSTKPQSVLNLLLLEHTADVEAVQADDGTLDAQKIAALVKKAEAAYGEFFKPAAPGSGSHSGGRLPDDSQQLDRMGRASTRAAIKRGF